MTDAFFRIQKESPDLYLLKVSYEGENWEEIGRCETQMDRPQLRLFSSGDVTVQYPRTFAFEAEFDYVRLRSKSSGD